MVKNVEVRHMLNGVYTDFYYCIITHTSIVSRSTSQSRNRSRSRSSVYGGCAFIGVVSNDW